MNASKENARMAYNVLNANGRSQANDLPVSYERADLKLVFEFLVAAERKLPTEATYAKEKARRRPTSKVS